VAAIAGGAWLLGAATASASDGDPTTAGGPLGGVVETVTTVTTVGTRAAVPAAAALAPVAESVADTAPVAEVTAPVADLERPVVEPITEVVQPITEPVEDAAAPVIEPVSEIVRPITEPVEDAAAPVIEPVTEIVQPIAEPIVDAVEPVIEPPDQPVRPGDPGPAGVDRADPARDDPDTVASSPLIAGLPASAAAARLTTALPDRLMAADGIVRHSPTFVPRPDPSSAPVADRDDRGPALPHSPAPSGPPLVVLGGPGCGANATGGVGGGGGSGAGAVHSAPPRTTLDAGDASGAGASAGPRTRPHDTSTSPD
jgi:hypothetical protein